MNSAGQIPPTHQLVIVHLSDIHFGDGHRFSPKPIAAGGHLPPAGHTSLLETLQKDLDRPDPGCPVIACISGDLTQTASPAEFRQAEKFIKGLADSRIFGKKLTLDNIFIVPGNHDLIYSETELEDRWAPWTSFYNKTFNDTQIDRTENIGMSFHNRIRDLNAVIVCLNSAEYVQRKTPRENDGLIDFRQLDALNAFLKSIRKAELASAIRIAVVHHHPVLIPGLVEADKGYDAIANAGFLLNELRRFGFHLVLHGHKHKPYHFSEDSYTAFHKEKCSPIVIVAGGSAGSESLPPEGENCYNRIAIKWNPDASQGRVLLWTNGLKVRDGGRELRPSEWHWYPRLIDDRQYIGGPKAPQTVVKTSRKFSDSDDGTHELKRQHEYSSLRRSMPVCEVMPSLVHTQHNEVRLWIEPHRPDLPGHEAPIEVTWSAGPRHPVVTVRKEEDPRFCATMHYYGPMLVQSRLRFADGQIRYAHVYARMPRAYARPDNTIDVG